MVASGICHTDLAVRDGKLPVSLPGVLGHEGAGIVEAVGSAVTAASPGDRVVMSFNSCGTCPSCSQQAPTYCYQFFPFNWKGSRPDGSTTVTKDDEPVNASFFGQSSFATHAIANERNVVKVSDKAAYIPLEQLAPIGCGLMTGAGAVLRSMKVKPRCTFDSRSFQKLDKKMYPDIPILQKVPLYRSYLLAPFPLARHISRIYICYSWL
jgi:aryl-alcohol dehydrogenase